MIEVWQRVVDLPINEVEPWQRRQDNGATAATQPWQRIEVVATGEPWQRISLNVAADPGYEMWQQRVQV